MARRFAVPATGIWIGGLVALAAAVVIAIVLRTDISGRGGSGLGKSFTFDDTHLRQVDPNLVIYEELAHAKIATGFTEARGLAVGAEGRVFVAGDEAVSIFGPDGKPQKQFATGGPARCVAAADDGTVYVGVADHIEMYDSLGGRRSAWPAPKDESLITSVTVWNDNVLGGFYRKRAGFVVRYDKSGRLLNEIMSRDDSGAVEGFVTPSPHLDAAVGANEVVWIANPGKLRVEAYTLAGQPLPALNWGKPSAGAARLIEGFVPCCNPTDFAILPDGGFVTAEKGIPRVKVYNAAGRFEGVVAGPDRFGPDASGLDVAVDAQGRVLVLDPPAKAVRVFVSRKKSAGMNADGR